MKLGGNCVFFSKGIKPKEKTEKTIQWNQANLKLSLPAVGFSPLVKNHHGKNEGNAQSDVFGTSQRRSCSGAQFFFCFKLFFLKLNIFFHHRNQKSFLRQRMSSYVGDFFFGCQWQLPVVEVHHLCSFFPDCKADFALAIADDMQEGVAFWFLFCFFNRFLWFVVFFCFFPVFLCRFDGRERNKMSARWRTCRIIIDHCRHLYVLLPAPWWAVFFFLKGFWFLEFEPNKGHLNLIMYTHIPNSQKSLKFSYTPFFAHFFGAPFFEQKIHQKKTSSLVDVTFSGPALYRRTGEALGESRVGEVSLFIACLIVFCFF